MSKVYETAEKYFTRKGDNRRLNDILRNINNPETKDGKPVLGTAKVPIDMLRFPLYQRDRLVNRNTDKIRRISDHFDILRSGCIEIVPNPRYGLFDVADGMGRVIAADMAGIDYLRANIHLAVLQSEVESYGARLFSDQSDGVDPIKPSQSHLAKLILKDPVVTILDGLSRKYDVLITPTEEQKASGHPYVKSYSDAWAIAKVNGAAGLEFAYRVIQAAGWNLETYGYAAYVLRMLKFMYQAYGKEKGAVAKLGGLLREYSPTGFKEKAHLLYPQREVRTACALLADDMLKEYYGKKRRLHFAGNKVEISA